MTYKVQNRQSIFDVALAATGSVESVVDIARLNGVGLDHVFELNSDVVVPNVVNRNIVNYVDNKPVVPVSEVSQIPPAVVGEIRTEGFGDSSQGWIRTSGEWVKIEDYGLLFINVVDNVEHNKTEFRLDNSDLSKQYQGTIEDYNNVTLISLLNKGLSTFFTNKFFSSFKELITLNLQNNNITEIELSGAKRLKNLVLRQNDIQILNLVECESLQIVNILENPIAEINFPVNSPIYFLSMSKMVLSSLDLTRLTSLSRLFVRDNLNLTTINLSTCTLLRMLYFDLSSNLVITTVFSSLIEYVDARNSGNTASDNTALMQSIINNNATTSGDFFCDEYDDETVADVLRNVPYSWNVTGNYVP